MEQNETVLANWDVDGTHVVFVAAIVTFVNFFLFAFSFTVIFILSKSTDIVLLLIPPILGIVFFASIPEFFKSLKSSPESSKIFVTSLGVYKGKGENRENYKFIPWGQMSGYDMRYLASLSPIGKLYIRPTQFFLKSKYEEDSFIVDAFGEDVDVLRAYLKENNVPFGFLKNS